MAERNKKTLQKRKEMSKIKNAIRKGETLLICNVLLTFLWVYMIINSIMNPFYYTSLVSLVVSLFFFVFSIGSILTLADKIVKLSLLYEKVDDA